MSLAQTNQTEQTRRLLRHVGEAVRRIEERHQAATKVETVFSVELLTLRSRLKELTAKLIQLDPVKLGTKAMEIYWKKAYHEPVALSRQLREEKLTKAELALVESQLSAGIGHYHHSIANFSLQFNCDLALDFSATSGSAYGFSSGGSGKRKDCDSEVAGWFEGAIVRCLVWLGDLARYLVEMCSADVSLPSRYYRQAVRIKPDIGLPYNQLATLCGERNNGLDQLYYYVRAVACSVSTESSEANLQRLLDKSEAANTVDEDLGTSVNMVVSIFHLVAVVWSKREQETITLACQASLGHLHQLLAAPYEDKTLEGPWLTLIVSLMIALQAKLHKEEKAVITDYRMGLCQAWLLALLSHLAQKVTMTVGKSVWGSSWQTPAIHLPEPVTEEGDVRNDNTKKKKNKLDELLRRRRRSGSLSGGEEQSEDDDTSDEIFLSDSDEDEISGAVLNSSSDSELDVVVETEFEEKPKIPTELDLIGAVEETGCYIPSIRLCLAWLATDMAEGVLAQTGPGSEQLWKNLASMFTALSPGCKPGIIEHSLRVERLRAESKHGGVLWEDWLLRGLVTEVTGIACVSGRDVRKTVQSVMRLEKLAVARDWLCNHVDSKIAWSDEHKMAYLRKEESEKQERETKKEKMKHMAELWLRQEVRDLEEQEASQDNTRGIVVLDGPSLAHGLAKVRRIVSLKRCVVIVPAVAVQQLDSLKKTTRVARDAIRWLERELGRGNSHLRAQAEGEALRLDKVEYPRQRDKTEWNRFQLLECVHYFLAKAVTEVTLVTNDEDLLSGESILPEMEGSWKIEDVKTFGLQHLGRRGGGKQAERRRGKLGSPAGQGSSKG